jgi:hypothetical protein
MSEFGGALRFREFHFDQELATKGFVKWAVARWGDKLHWHVVCPLTIIKPSRFNVRHPATALDTARDWTLRVCVGVPHSEPPVRTMHSAPCPFCGDRVELDFKPVAGQVWCPKCKGLFSPHPNAESKPSKSKQTERKGYELFS